MQKAQENPIYTVILVDPEADVEYDLTPAVLALNLSDPEEQMAQIATFDVANIKVGDKRLSSILAVRMRVFIYANDGEKKDEVFRGITWTRYTRSTNNSKTLTVTGYDNLIYLQESEDSLYFSAGKSTKDVMGSICDDWGVKLDYDYSSITHSKLVLRGALSDIITADILDKVKEQTGDKYVILSIKDKMTIRRTGQNEKVYKIEADNNTVSTQVKQTMDGMITKVVILGKADSNDRLPVQATVTGDTDKYGTLQKLYDQDENTSLAQAKREANTIINEKGAPFWIYEVQAPDIPWIRKGDLVYVNAGAISKQNLIVKGVTRNISNSKKTMTLTLEKKEKATKAAGGTGYTGTYPELPPRGYYTLGDGYNTLTGYRDQIKLVQQLVNWINDGNIEVDGWYGPNTVAAVKAAQNDLGVTVDGSFGPITLAAAKNYKK